MSYECEDRCARISKILKEYFNIKKCQPVPDGYIKKLIERNIQEKWVSQTIDNSDWKNVGSDNNIHYFKGIAEHEGRILHVVVNPHVSPKKVVTIFFDRRTRRQK